MRIEPCRADEPAIVALIAALDAYQSRLYPAASNHLMGIDALLQPDVRMFAARIDDQRIGCGAIRRGEGYAEMKRLYVDPAFRGRGVARGIIAHLERAAAAEGFAWMRLETGIHQHAAIALYRSLGYRDGEPFGDYIYDPLSVFMERSVDCHA